MRRPALILLLAVLAAGRLRLVRGRRRRRPGRGADRRTVGRAGVRRGSGDARLETAVPDPSWEQLGPGLDMPAGRPEEVRHVHDLRVDPEDPEAVKSLLADKDTAKPLQADADGIYWDFDELAKSTSPRSATARTSSSPGGTRSREGHGRALAASVVGVLRAVPAARLRLERRPAPRRHSAPCSKLRPPWGGSTGRSSSSPAPAAASAARPRSSSPRRARASASPT